MNRNFCSFGSQQIVLLVTSLLISSATIANQRSLPLKFDVFVNAIDNREVDRVLAESYNNIDGLNDIEQFIVDSSNWEHITRCLACDFHWTDKPLPADCVETCSLAILIIEPVRSVRRLCWFRSLSNQDRQFVQLDGRNYVGVLARVDLESCIRLVFQKQYPAYQSDEKSGWLSDNEYSRRITHWIDAGFKGDKSMEVDRIYASVYHAPVMSGEIWNYDVTACAEQFLGAAGENLHDLHLNISVNNIEHGSVVIKTKDRLTVRITWYARQSDEAIYDNVCVGGRPFFSESRKPLENLIKDHFRLQTGFLIKNGPESNIQSILSRSKNVEGK